MVVDGALSPPGRVLVLDDNETSVLSLQGILELDGYVVVGATSALRALAVAEIERFDVILTDVDVDGLNGIELLRHARAQSPDAVCVMLTGAVSALPAGAYDYVLKPCDALELRRTVARALERARMAAQLGELREQMLKRDELLATLSHDLKSPITFIKGLASVRRRRAVVTPETQPLIDALDEIGVAAGRMARQLDEVVDASRLAGGRSLDLWRTPTDLVKLARKAVAEHQLAGGGRALQVTATPSEVVGSWDEPRLLRVLDRLLERALKLNPAGPPIQVAISLEDGLAALRVSDVGEGNAAGLSGVRDLVQLHGGTAEVERRADSGTTFLIRLPLDPPLA